MGEGRGTPEGYFQQISSIYLLRFARFDYDFLAGMEGAALGLGGIGKMGVGKGVGTPEGYFHEISSIYLLRFARFEFLNFSE